MNIDSRTLYESLNGETPPLVLDVRNEDEFARWKLEAVRAVETLNIPYFAFIEDEAASATKVEDWMAGRNRNLVVVCAKGGSSEFVANILHERGLSAANLDGGMTAWGSATVYRSVPADPIRVWQVVRFGKGCLSYVLAGGRDAIVVDPHRDVEELHGFLDNQRLALRGVFDTHLHADHLSGGPALAESAGAPYYANPIDFDGGNLVFSPIEDGSRIRLGDVQIATMVLLHAPGHTPGSTALAVNDAFLLTGDTLFVESVGRPDLAGKAAEWGADLFRTLHTRLAGLGDEVLVLPAHTSGPREAKPDGTVGEKLGVLRRKNASLRLDERAFLREVEQNLAPAPAHYETIRKLNLGVASASAEEVVEMEIGKNECAVSRRIGR